MKYDVKELEKMSQEDLLRTYREARTTQKKAILKSLANSWKFNVLMVGLDSSELIEMAKIHPYKEVIVDTMIEEMQTNTMIDETGKMDKRKENISYIVDQSFEKALQHRSIFDKIKETFSRKPALPESLPKKIEQAKKIFEIVERRNNATGKKIEGLETQELDKVVDESRVETSNGEMAKLFDRYAKETREEESGIFGKYRIKIEQANKVKTQLTEEYISILGTGREDVAKLVAMKEFENNIGEFYYVDGRKDYENGKNYKTGYSENIGGVTSGWQRHLLEVEQVQDFTAGKHNFGEVFIVKSEFCPPKESKWTPTYEYYTKDENGEMVCIGCGTMDLSTGKMQTMISIDEQDRPNDIEDFYSRETEFIIAKENGTVMQFDSNEYTGKSTKISRKGIEQAITTKSIQAYLGKGKQIADITQVKDIPVVTYDESGNPQTQNAYMVACVENGIESYEMVCIGEDGKCKSYPGMNKDMFAKKEVNFPNGMVTCEDKQKMARGMDVIQALETFKSKDGMQYSAYRDKNGILRVAQMVEFANSNQKYATELDTYSVKHGDIKRIKEQSKDEYNKSLALLKSKETEKNNGLRLENKDEGSLSL